MDNCSINHRIPTKLSNKKLQPNQLVINLIQLLLPNLSNNYHNPLLPTSINTLVDLIKEKTFIQKIIQNILLFISRKICSWKSTISNNQNNNVPKTRHKQINIFHKHCPWLSIILIKCNPFIHYHPSLIRNNSKTTNTTHNNNSNFTTPFNPSKNP